VAATTGRYYNVSEHGFRLVKNQGPWPLDDSAFNVFVFGASDTFGTGVTDEQTIPSYLQDSLASGNQGRSFVYNFGSPGYFTTQQRILFENLALAGITPDLAVFINGLSEFINPEGEPLQSDTFRELVAASNEEPKWHEPYGDALRQLPMNRLANRINWQLKRWTGRGPNLTQEEEPSSDELVVTEMVNRWLTNKKFVEGIADAVNVRTLFVVQPVLAYKYDLSLSPFVDDRTIERIQVHKAGYTLMDELLPTLDLDNEFLWLADIQADKKQNLYVDRGHYLPEFSQEIAALIYREIRQRGLLKTEATAQSP
jgi:hypothetical protein